MKLINILLNLHFLDNIFEPIDFHHPERIFQDSLSEVQRISLGIRLAVPFEIIYHFRLIQRSHASEI